MSQAVVARLEAVAARLESVASKLGRGGGGGGGDDDDDDDLPEFVTDFQNLLKNEVTRCVKASEALKIKEIPAILQKGFNNIVDLVVQSASCKKPSPKDMMAYLAPGVEAINEADALRRKRTKKFTNQYNAFYETMMGISWVTMSPPNGLPLQHVEAQQQATDFSLNKILVAAKTANDAEVQREFVKAFQALNKQQYDLVKKYFKRSGLEYNPKGGELGSAKTPAAPKEESKEAAPASKPKPAAKGKAGGADMANVFGQLNKGLNVTGGLKKVTSDMKTKNRKNRSGLVSAPAKKKQNKPKRKKGEPVTNLKGFRWMVENYNEEIVTLSDATLKQNVYISMADGTTIDIPNKVKAVTIDSCNKTRVFVTEVVSTVEVVNCKSVTIIIRTKAPSVSIDKSSSPRIILLKEAFDASPDIYTSKIDAMNVEIPGVNDGDDPVEIAVPEQFLTKIDPATRKVTTTEVQHG